MPWLNKSNPLACTVTYIYAIAAHDIPWTNAVQCEWQSFLYRMVILSAMAMYFRILWDEDPQKLIGLYFRDDCGGVVPIERYICFRSCVDCQSTAVCHRMKRLFAITEYAGGRLLWVFWGIRILKECADKMLWLPWTVWDKDWTWNSSSTATARTGFDFHHLPWRDETDGMNIVGIRKLTDDQPVHATCTC